MKRVILSIICILFVTLSSCNSDKCQVKVVGYYQKPGGNYVELTTPVLPADVVNLKYAYTLKAKDDKHSVINCTMKFPKCMNIELTSLRGVQAGVLKDSQTAAMLAINEKGDYKYCEFLIPQREEGSGFVEFQVKDGYKLKGKDIPVEFMFTRYEQPFSKRNEKDFFTVASLFVNPFVVGAVYTPNVNKTITKAIQTMKVEYSGEEMNDSYHVFTLQFR